MEKRVTLHTGITAGVPSKNHVVFTREALEDAIKDFKECQNGGILNRKEIEKDPEPTHKTLRLFLEGDDLMAEFEVIDEELSNRLEAGQKFVAKPIIVHKLNSPLDIKNVRRVDVEEE
jgi:hypothetical protein